MGVQLLVGGEHRAALKIDRSQIGLSADQDRPLNKNQAPVLDDPAHAC
jgi:hypothetical protein